MPSDSVKALHCCTHGSVGWHRRYEGITQTLESCPHVLPQQSQFPPEDMTIFGTRHVAKCIPAYAETML